MQTPSIVFVGGGNMASALLGGLLRSGHDAADVAVVEPLAAQRAHLAQQFGITTLAAPAATLAGATLFVWAVKPQVFAQAALPLASMSRDALHLSVMAGIVCAAIERATGAARIVRSMPNTPALIGRGIAGLYATPTVSADERARIEALLAPTGETLWLQREADLDAVTALSGSGPAYVFFFLEAMLQAAQDMGLDAAQGRALALATFAGATELAARSDEPISLLRERVTSKGGTTYAALTSMQADDVQGAIVKAIRAAQQRAQELGQAG